VPSNIPAAAIAELRTSLLAFFDATRRDLPWRGHDDPYRIWVSEVMAQQTRIDTVIPYYERWVERFPDVHALADAPLDDVLKQWEGLGYYSRARNLHAAARVIRERHAGRVPDTAAALRELPGVGEYTAGAVASIAYGRRAAAVDGNVRRVLARLLDEPTPAAARLREVAAQLVPADRPGDFNQALMELGSRVCTPRAPRCADCPIRAHCAARAAGTQLDRPRRVPKQAVPVYDVAILIVRAPDGRVLLVRRPDTGLLAGMWSFPAAQVEDGQAAGDAVLRVAAGLGLHVSRSAVGPSIGMIEHAFSHRRERYDCRLLDIASTAVAGDGCAWVGADVSGYTLPRAQQKIHALAFGVTRRGSPR
jgi:A/G-specific adenine glycosylase